MLMLVVNEDFYVFLMNMINMSSVLKMKKKY